MGGSDAEASAVLAPVAVLALGEEAILLPVAVVPAVACMVLPLGGTPAEDVGEAAVADA